MLSRANARVEGKPDKVRVVDLRGRDNFFRTFPEAMQGCRQLEHAGAAAETS